MALKREGSANARSRVQLEGYEKSWGVIDSYWQGKGNIFLLGQAKIEVTGGHRKAP